MGQIKWIFFFNVISFITISTLKAQVIDEVSIKTALISNFIENCYWPNEDRKDTYTMLLHGNDTAFFQQVKQDLTPRKFHDKSLIIKDSNGEEEFLKADIILVASSHSNEVGRIFQLINGKPILLLSDNAQSKGQLMINFIRIKNKVGYQINPLNLIRQGFKIDKELLIYADNTMDYPDQFIEIEKDLAEQRMKITEREERIIEQENIISSKEDETWRLENRLNEMTHSIDAYEQKINDQETHIEQSSKQLDSLNNLLVGNKELLTAYMDSINLNRMRMNNQMAEIEDHATKINEQLEILAEQEKRLKSLDEQVKEQEDSIDHQELIIEKQADIIILFSVLVFVIIVLGVLSFIALQRNRKARIILKKQNEEIALSKEMLQKQADKLKQAKEKIEEYNQILEETNQNLESEVVQRTKHLTKTNKELDRFVYSVSHDIKAPLASIMGIVNLMKYEQLEDVIREYISKIETSVVKLNLFITEVLEVSRNARIEISKEKVNLSELIDSVFDELKYLQEEKIVDLNVVVDENHQLITDRSRLVIILKNIISNSLKYYNPKSSKCTISITAKVVHDACRIIVADNGMGINKEHQDKVFDMFYRAHEKSEGSGLGLYIVKETLERINGKIKIKSKRDHGTTVIIVLPNYLQGISQQRELSMN